MKHWTKEHKRLVGRIIFANFLNLPLEKYKNIIKDAEHAISLEIMTKNNFSKPKNKYSLNVKHLSSINIFPGVQDKSSKTIAEILKNNNSFSIRYVYEGFNKMYTMRKVSCRKLYYKLRCISLRNKITDRIIKGIIRHQKKYFISGDPFDLVPFSQIQLSKMLNGSRSQTIDTSWISRLVKKISIVTPSGEENLLKYFFQNQKDVNKRLIKKLLDKENEDIVPKEIKKPLTDSQIRDRLYCKHGLKLSRRLVSICRHEMGIPNAKRRFLGYKYPPLFANFSILYVLAVKSVKSNVPAIPGIYEFRLTSKEIEYPIGKSKVIYIGSAKNLRKRLMVHLKQNKKNSHMSDFLREFDCSFRYIRFSKNWKEEERRLYNLFVATHGAPPKCNRIRP